MLLVRGGPFGDNIVSDDYIVVHTSLGGPRGTSGNRRFPLVPALLRSSGEGDGFVTPSQRLLGRLVVLCVPEEFNVRLFFVDVLDDTEVFPGLFLQLVDDQDSIVWVVE